MLDSQNNPMQQAAAPRCGAKTRRRTPCQAPAIRGKTRCRMHGGAPGSGAPKGNQNARKHGFYSAEMLRLRAEARTLLKELLELTRGDP
jgi:glucans biosynthesis protein